MTTKTYTVLTVPGIGEPASVTPSGMLANLTKQLPERFDCYQFNWQNTYGPVPRADGASYGRNKALAVTAVTNRINALLTTGTQVILVGYSGGAHVASEALTRMAWQGRTSKHLPAAVMVSNPLRGRNDGALATTRYGIAGEHGTFPLGMKLFDLANPVDVICQCPPPPHPLRSFTDLTEHFSLSDPLAWGTDLVTRANTGRWQNAWRLSSLPSWWDAVALARGYAFDGQHTNWYVPRLPELGRRLAVSL